MPHSKLRQKYQSLHCTVIITAIPEEYEAVRTHFSDIDIDKWQLLFWIQRQAHL
ncbi:hypothetical protein SAMD00079811_32540 [Scytonema sp. HK-05]|jgi:Ni/Fe-hydrogenase subunit HybB-like protein|uniref:hypothetical protein n=1 Tax=Scytonema sp. HK-05 TaxID=1137095 RepID=UPI000A978548|nr:hypothetical protein [Scytonema sp. HK-05]BAY45647.1 hypothetical protein SAMD00079811_32540 [Scytonema sp. HK-05]